MLRLLSLQFIAARADYRALQSLIDSKVRTFLESELAQVFAEHWQVSDSR